MYNTSLYYFKLIQHLPLHYRNPVLVIKKLILSKKKLYEGLFIILLF